MQTMIFVSRHKPTADQIEEAARLNFNVVHVGDVDAFGPDVHNTLARLVDEHKASALCAVHPRVALIATVCNPRLQYVGVFQNVNRAPEGAPPKFECGGLYLHTTKYF